MKANLRIPAALKKGDTIGFLSPAAGLAPFAMHRIERAVSFFESKGYKVKIAKNALKNNGYVSASVNERVDDVHSLFADLDVKAIIATIGGFNSNQLLDKLDYQLISRNPKIFVGYSDITTLHFAFQKKAHLATFYGPCVMTQFGEYPVPLRYTEDAFFNTLTNLDKPKKFKISQSEEWTEEGLDWFKKLDLTRARKTIKNLGYEWIRRGKSLGWAWGGTIPTINGLVGTKYWMDPEGSIFFLDLPEGKDYNSGLPLAEVDFYLQQLKYIGVFKSIKGLIIGRPYKYTKEEYEKLKKTMLEVAKGTNYPILSMANIGHVDPIITLRYGSNVELDSSKKYFELS